jgi:HSP20 family molecular chaperone IbpA
MADMTTAPAKDKAEVQRAETTHGGVLFTPRVDIVETDKELTLFAEVPGVKPADVHLRYENGELVLHGKVQPRHPEGPRGFLLREYDQGDFYRAFAIHETIDASKIEAEFKNGVLTVHLAKVEAMQPRQINVRAN